MQSTILISFFLVTAITVHGAATDIIFFPKRPALGGVVLIQYPLKAAETDATFSLTVNQKPVPWALCPQIKARQLCAFLGIPLDDAPAALDLRVTKNSATGLAEVATNAIPLEGESHTTSQLTIAPGHAEPSPENKLRMEDERSRVKAIFQSGAPNFLWNGAFIFPVPGKPTGLFGNQRVFNGKSASTHYGLDLRGNHKTVVKSANSGKVVFAESLFNAGNFVVLDHGGGVFTTYSHLSAFTVKVGEVVERGQPLGRAGSTGRVTGPHLHWSVRIHDLQVDPLEFMKVSRQLEAGGAPFSI